MNIALFFGSFNPLHNGHMSIAKFVLTNKKADQVWFVVSPQNPLKDKSILGDPNLRLEMVKQSLLNYSGFRLCDIEFSLPQPSYTYNTLSELKRLFPQHNLILLIGSDSLDTFLLWKNYKSILENYSIYVYPRKEGYTIPDEYQHFSIELLESPLLSISSTLIRELINNNKPIHEFVPEAVFKHL